MRSMFPSTVVIALAGVLAVGSSASVGQQAASREIQAELKKFQGLWQDHLGGMEHRDGQQVVRQPDASGTHFFIYTDRLIWLDDEGRPSGLEDKIILDITTEPKRIRLLPLAGDKDRKPLHGIYVAEDSGLRVHFGLEGQPAPRQFLELNNPLKGVNGEEWMISRKRLRDR